MVVRPTNSGEERAIQTTARAAPLIALLVQKTEASLRAIVPDPPQDFVVLALRDPKW